MKQAIKLSQKGLGKTSPNPPVGAVIVKDKKITISIKGASVKQFSDLILELNLQVSNYIY